MKPDCSKPYENSVCRNSCTARYKPYHAKFIELSMMKKQRKTYALLLGLVGLLLLTCIAPNYSQAPADRKSKTYEFRNGRWFDGRTFREKIFYSLDGRLTK